MNVQNMVCHGLDTPERICFYEQDFYVFSNFSSFRLRWMGIDFDTSEAAYQWTKFRWHAGADDIDRELGRIQNRILKARSAHEAFKTAEVFAAYKAPGWDDEMKDNVMREILRAKARQHEYVRRKLPESGDRELVENSHRDPYWGWGENGDGLNKLGKLWMEVREEIHADG